MSTVHRLKQALMGIGALTVAAGIVFVGVIGYMWWDTRDSSVDHDINTNTDFEADTGVETDFDPGADTDGTSDDAESESTELGNEGEDAEAEAE